MKSSFQMLFFLILALASCKTAQVVYTPTFDTEAMPVKGRNGLQIGQVIRFGEYHTDKVRRGWTKSYSVPFVLRFQGAKEKLSFTQFGPGNLQAEVACVSKFKSVELPLIRDFFSVPVDLKNYFAGTITPNDGSPNWDFILYNPNGDFLRDQPSSGFIKNEQEIIAIQPIRGLEGQPEWLKNLGVYGHEFSIEGQVVGAVSTLNNGTVWLAPTLDDRLKTVIASVATGLLLRNDVEEASAM